MTCIACGDQGYIEKKDLPALIIKAIFEKEKYCTVDEIYIQLNAKFTKVAIRKAINGMCNCSISSSNLLQMTHRNDQQGNNIPQYTYLAAGWEYWRKPCNHHHDNPLAVRQDGYDNYPDMVTEISEYQQKLRARIAEMKKDLRYICGWLDDQEDSIKAYLPGDLFELAKKYATWEVQSDEQNT